MTILTVFKTQFTIGSVLVDGYTANEVDPATGKFINYLSGAGLAASIGLANTTTMQNRLSVDLKAILGDGFTTMQGQYKNPQNSWSKINLWDTTTKQYFLKCPVLLLYYGIV